MHKLVVHACTKLECIIILSCPDAFVVKLKFKLSQDHIAHLLLGRLTTLGAYLCEKLLSHDMG